jgi:transcriptional regulator with XRE-family HTH domain
MSENVTASVTPMRELIAEEIRALLARRKITASELARRLHVSQPYISRRLTGDTAFDVDDLDRIAAELDVDIADLFPPRRQGRLITTGGAARQGQATNNKDQSSLPTRTPLVGYPNRTHTDMSTRRPVRILAGAHA